MQYFIGLDDTDNEESRGTGFNARQLAKILEEKNLGIIDGITRHQLFIHDSIPYTSQNSSATISLTTNNIEIIKKQAREYLLEIAPEGCDIGLCISGSDIIHQEIIEWGYRAKKEVLTRQEAITKAKDSGIYLEGLTGTHDGIIGALAAIGLRRSNNDGRYIWLRKKKELRDIEPGVLIIRDLKIDTGIDLIQTMEGLNVKMEEKILIEDWVRPILRNNQVILLVEKVKNENAYEWKCASKELVRSVS